MRTCPICRKEVKPCRGNPNQVFCSRACRNKSLATKVEKACERCGKRYLVKASQGERSRYCSVACKSHRVTYTCEMCGKVRSVPASATAKRFCGDRCRLQWFSAHFSAEQSPHWKGGDASYYGPNWRQQRNKARWRDNHTCQHCGKTRDQLPEELSVAHIIPFRDFGLPRYREANVLANLITLCRKCHIKFDWKQGVRS